MKRFFKDKRTAKDCRIYQMLLQGSKDKSLVFHMPGHKLGKWDITELSYSDNLCAPHGCIAEAEAEIAEILGARRSFLLTDGSTSGVLSMLYAAKQLGIKKIAVVGNAHKSLFHGCQLVGITPLVCGIEKRKSIPFLPTMSALKENFSEILAETSGIFITSPDYYGNVADWQALRAYCTEENKLLLVDGAHGGHLHFDKKLYAGTYADMWVDGAHKSLPALTQGAVLSAKTENFANALWEGVQIFRTTSPSYPVMATIEYAVKYPRNEKLEKEALNWIAVEERLYKTSDWTKVCALFGKYAFAANEELEKKGIYAEFCDGNVVQFYLSPLTKLRALLRLKKELKTLFEKYPYEEGNTVESVHIPPLFHSNGAKEWVDIEGATGRICALSCGMFPPCTPLICEGERVTEEKVALLKRATNVYGLLDGKILLFKEE